MSMQPYEFRNALWAPYLSLLLLALLVRPSPYRSLFFLPLLPLTAYVLLCTTGTFNGDYYLGSTWLTWFFFASDYILLTDVQRALRQVRLKRIIVTPAASEPEGPIENATLWRRTRWALALLNSPRGVGWAHEPAALPVHPPAGTPRATFVAQRLFKAAQFFVLYDASNLHVHKNTMFHANGPDWTAHGWGWRAVAAAGWGLSVYSKMMLGSSLYSAASVACGLSDPEEWPPLFAGPREAYTIRRFWGRAWHQLMRRFLSSHGKHLAHRVLKLSPGSNASAYVQLYTAFAISGLIHYATETMAFRHWGSGAQTFFMLQACAITLEDFIVFVAKKAGFRKGLRIRVLGYAWTWAWLALTLPAWQVQLARAGMMEDGLPPSVLLWLWQVLRPQ
ncbi:membrane bound O-acyl transferase family-domain-containing protein [Mycena capillaripes]|nr:membrane bound O-acyl transferase family-domain-containing protein [Mycena capillaripes]